jgi:hypothetical protein
MQATQSFFWSKSCIKPCWKNPHIFKHFGFYAFFILQLLPGKPWIVTRETIEGWPLPTVETEAKGDSRSTHDWFAGLVMQAQEVFVPSFAALVSPVQNIFPYRTQFPFICPRRLASWAGRQSCRVAFLIESVSELDSPCDFHSVFITGLFSGSLTRWPSCWRVDSSATISTRRTTRLPNSPQVATD